MNLRINPIIKKDLQVTVRNMRFSWALFAHEGVLALAFLMALAVIKEENSGIYGSANFYSELIYLFPIIGIVQVCIVTLIVPIITASAISGEKERQTFDIMLTTCMSPFTIVVGKVFSAVLRILFFVAAGMPVMALSFVVGGLNWSNLFYFVLTIILLSVLSGSIGIFCSSFCRRSIAAMIFSYAWYFVIYIMTFVPSIMRRLWWEETSMGETMLFWLFNPIIFFEEFFMQMMTGESLFGTQGSRFTRNEVGDYTYYLSQGKEWLFLSAACILLMSVLFMYVAAWKVNPMHSFTIKLRKIKH